MFKKIIFFYLAWRIGLFIIAFLSIYFLPTFGARFPYTERVLEITRLPYWIWGWGNFDGVHYLRIAQDGYAAQYSQAFFPFFPTLIRIFSFLSPRIPNLDTNIYTDPAYFYSGFILTNLFFIVALFVLYKLIKIDFKADVAKWSIIFLLAFPTSFYFGAIYTESLFLLLAASSVYLIRERKYFLSSFLISLATATRLIGIFLVLLYLIELIKNKNWKPLVYVPIMFVGIVSYIYYLRVTFNNPLYFLTSQSVFGAERSAEIVLLPQVIFRYVKIFVTTNIFSLTFFNALLEFLFTLVPLGILILLFKKMRFSYWIFTLGILLLPTLTGTFSSMPRYALMSFLLLPLIVKNYQKYLKQIMILSILLGIVLISLFIRGYWVA